MPPSWFSSLSLEDVRSFPFPTPQVAPTPFSVQHMKVLHTQISRSGCSSYPLHMWSSLFCLHYPGVCSFMMYSSLSFPDVIYEFASFFFTFSFEQCKNHKLTIFGLFVSVDCCSSISKCPLALLFNSFHWTCLGKTYQLEGYLLKQNSNIPQSR